MKDSLLGQSITDVKILADNNFQSILRCSPFHTSVGIKSNVFNKPYFLVRLERHVDDLDYNTISTLEERNLSELNRFASE